MKSAKLTLFLYASIICSAVHGQQLSPVKDIHPSSSSDIMNQFTMNGAAYFSATNGVNGRELWKSDGTTAGTFMVKDINPTGDSNPSAGKVWGNKFLFTASNNTGSKLFISNGTASGTFILRDIVPFIDHFTEYNGKIYFTMYDALAGVELWETDGTSAGTKLFLDLNPGINYSQPSNLVVLDSMLYFTASNGITGNELWKTDGTVGGTELVKDIRPGPQGSYALDLFVFNARLYFSASDVESSNHRETWVSDGTSSGTVILKDINPTGSSRPSDFSIMNNEFYFLIRDDVYGNVLWKSDGTPSGTVLLKIINPSAFTNSTLSSVVLNNQLYFSSSNGVDGAEPWITDGTTAGTTMLKNINPSGDSNPTSFFLFQNEVYFAANDGGNIGIELYKTNGTSNGTVKISNNILTALNPLALPFKFMIVNNDLLFNANYDASENELWKLNGTVGVENLSPEIGINIHPNPANELLFINAEESVTLTLMNLNGQILKTFESAMAHQVDVSSLSQGMYLIGVNGTQQIHRFVKQ